MNLQDKFTAANDYLVNSILEKMLGRLPSRDELRQGITIKFNSETHESKIFWKSKLIMLSSIRMIKNYEDQTIITGSFDIPEQFMDEFIQEKIDTWHQ